MRQRCPQHAVFAAVLTLCVFSTQTEAASTTASSRSIDLSATAPREATEAGAVPWQNPVQVSVVDPPAAIDVAARHEVGANATSDGEGQPDVDSGEHGCGASQKRATPSDTLGAADCQRSCTYFFAAHTAAVAPLATVHQDPRTSAARRGAMGGTGT